MERVRPRLQILCILGGTEAGRGRLSRALVADGAQLIQLPDASERAPLPRQTAPYGPQVQALRELAQARSRALTRRRRDRRALPSACATDPEGTGGSDLHDRAAKAFQSLIDTSPTARGAPEGGAGPLWVLTDAASLWLLPFWREVIERLDAQLQLVFCVADPREFDATDADCDGDAAEARAVGWTYALAQALDAGVGEPILVDEARLQRHPGAEVTHVRHQLAGIPPRSDADSDPPTPLDAAPRADAPRTEPAPGLPPTIELARRTLHEWVSSRTPPGREPIALLRTHLCRFLEDNAALHQRLLELERSRSAHTRLALLEEIETSAAARRALWMAPGSLATLCEDLRQLSRMMRSALRSSTWRLAAIPRKLRRGGPQSREAEASLFRQLDRLIRVARHAPEARELHRSLRNIRNHWTELTASRAFASARSVIRMLHSARGGRPAEGEFEQIPRVFAQLEARLQSLVDYESAARAPHSAPASRVIDVIVPVYRGLEETWCALDSVLRAQGEVSYALLVVDDCSPEPELSALLDRLHASGSITLLRNDTNLGFVGSVNRGMALHPDRDVILLNSDTEVSGDWLDRLHRSAYSSPDIGTLTPFSNNATILSYPRIAADNPFPHELCLSELDAIFARSNAGRVVDLPTAVGFCMYIKRACLSDVGMFDEERWGRGYGEENDFCLRAQKRGWRSVAACDVFVRHSGGVAFQGEKDARVVRALRTLDALYPDYTSTIQRFLRHDPLLVARRNVDLARMAERYDDVFLFVTHHLGGGTERHVQALADWLAARGIGCAIVRPTTGRNVELSMPGVPGTANLEFELPSDYRALRLALQRLPLRHAHIHHLIDVPQSMVELIDDLGLTYDVTLHDYFMLCPRVTLIDASGRYCREAPIERCESCAGSSSDLARERGIGSVAEWRERSSAILRGARKRFAPSADTAARFARYWPELEVSVRPHFDRPDSKWEPQSPRGERVKRVAVIGAVGPHKGYELLLACARDAAARELPLEFVLFGYSCADEPLLETGRVEITGRYVETELSGLLEKHAPSAALFVSLWPETYSYTLSIALASRLFPFALDIGAPAERLRQLSWGRILPLDVTPDALNDALIATRPTPFPVDGDAIWTSTYSDVLHDYYALPERAIGRRG